MGLFDKFFGRKKAAAVGPVGERTEPEAPSSAAEEKIKVFDQFGRELHLSKQDWLKHMLLPNIEKAWNDADKLAGYIINGLQDGFARELLPAAARLAEMDANAERGAVLHAATLLKSGQAGESERVLTQHISKHGRSGVVMTNLAKVYAERKEDARVLAALWEGLELDPNQDNAVMWYEVAHRDKSGEAAGLEALRRIAALPGSWRAQVWLAREELKERHLEQALALYTESLERAPRPVPTDLLVQMSGDLGNLGHLPELLNLTEPHFVPAEHGMEVGNNLIKACLDLGLLDEARPILDQLHALKRPDWMQGLSYWDTELAKARLETTPPPEEAQVQLSMLTVQGPVWLKPDSPAVELFPVRAEGGPTLCVVGGCVEQATNSKRMEQTMSDVSGRLSRALPLFLSEHIHWGSDATCSVLLPWVVKPTPGFAVNGVPWEDGEVAHLARQTPTPSDYAVYVNLKAQTEPALAEIRLIRTIDANCVGMLSLPVAVEAPGADVMELADKLQELLCQEADAERAAMPDCYAIPAVPDLPNYLLRLEQLLAVRCAGMEGVRAEFLSGQHEILNGSLHLCLSYPESLSMRLLFAQALLTMKKSCPSAVADFQEKARLLQKMHPLEGAAQGVVERMINEAFGN
ncbi:tetratricopeptide repeat protein [Prosthecobacter vanneervenii]|uniref:Tetratricopeptide (TPR) repeat protein n=1 Tax=Prosthecobacter vanneervenii TaxID=48466 RepID=A0A7W8DJC0_9BACT|nr:tetratricopeptide repeat protein [Prosthecobacter vanneervenii]MBB5031969.1 tetratricopeptide (TPR) repeat protein [Prosthecobacter vanneervenii]